MADMDEDIKLDQSKELAANIETTTPTIEQIAYKPYAYRSRRDNIGGWVCIGATIMIVILLICILIFYVFKDQYHGI